jgi:hypothetical protein
MTGTTSEERFVRALSMVTGALVHLWRVQKPLLPGAPWRMWLTLRLANGELINMGGEGSSLEQAREDVADRLTAYAARQRKG